MGARESKRMRDGVKERERERTQMCEWVWEGCSGVFEKAINLKQIANVSLVIFLALSNVRMYFETSVWGVSMQSDAMP